VDKLLITTIQQKNNSANSEECSKKSRDKKEGYFSHFKA